jgi:hypothetical protein
MRSIAEKCSLYECPVAYSPECVEGEFCEVELRLYGFLGSSYPALCIAPVLCPNSATVAGVSFGGILALPGLTFFAGEAVQRR